jgi:eukaryotic-like serine/threonine-protein kinase
LTGAAPKLRGTIAADGPLSGVAFSPDSGRLAFATPNNTKIFDVTGPEPKKLFDLNVNATRYPGVAWSPDGNTLAVSDNESAALLDMTKSPPVELPRAKGHKNSVRTVAFNKDGTKLVTASEDSTCRIWDMKTSPPTELAVLPTDRGVWQAAFSPDGTMVAAGTGNGTVYLWDVSGPKPEQSWYKKGHAMWANSVAFAPDGKTLASSEGGDRPGNALAVLWNVANGEILKSWALPERSSQCVFAPSGRYLAITSHDKKLYVLRLAQP